ncbi:MAG: hypothetical protein ABIH53_01880 [archaeon]
MAEDLGLGLRFKVLAEQIVEHALKENKMINSFFLLKSVSRNPDQRANPEGIGYAGTGDKNPEDYEELTNGVTLFKGPLIKMLDKMRLVKSRAELVKGVVMKDDEITPSQIYTQEELDNFDASDFELVLKEELEEKYSEKPVVISPE